MLIDSDAPLIVDAVVERLRALGQAPLESETPQECVLRNMSSPIRFFVKNEPHGAKKFATSRWRLISNIDLIDLLVEKLLFDKQNKAEIQSWQTNPSAPGINLSGDKELNAFAFRVSDLSDGLRTAASADVTGFDWSVKEWELQLDARVRMRLMGCDPQSWLGTVITNRIYCLSRPLYVMPNGELLIQVHPGVQKSGSNNTSSTNSRIRVALAYLVGADWAIAMGDDCVEQFVEGAEERYAALGHPLKMYEQCEDSFTFCSMLFDGRSGLIHPEDGTKALFNLLEQVKDLDVHLDEFSREMRNHPRLAEFMSIAETALARKYTQCNSQLPLSQ